MKVYNCNVFELGPEDELLVCSHFKKNGQSSVSIFPAGLPPGMFRIELRREHVPALEKAIDYLCEIDEEALRASS